MNNVAESELCVAETIRAQLGGALAMLGAHQVYGGTHHLAFKIQSSRKVSMIEVRLESDDTYTVTCWKRKAYDVKQVAQDTGVYVDGLKRVLEQRTGLYVSL